MKGGIGKKKGIKKEDPFEERKNRGREEIE